jgi:hypothetical protein
MDYLVGIPQLFRQHTGDNITEVIEQTLTTFKIRKEQLGYFVLDNAYNNNTAIKALSERYNFIFTNHRLRCACHYLNLSAQTIIWGRIKSRLRTLQRTSKLRSRR